LVKSIVKQVIFKYLGFKCIGEAERASWTRACERFRTHLRQRSRAL